MKKSAEQRRREAQKKKAAKLSEKPKTIVSPVLPTTTTTQDSHENQADNHAKGNAVQSKQNNRFAGKTYRMSIFLSVLALAVFGVLASVAIANWQKGNVWPALWWGIGAYAVFGAGAIFTYYHSVIQPKETAKSATESDIKERPFVFIKHISLQKPLSAGKKPAIVFIVANSGPMEAEVSLWDSGSYFEPINGHGPPPMYSKTAPIVFNLVPTAEATGRISFLSLNLTASEIKQIIEGRANLYFFARGQYKDEFGRTWEFPFCRKYSPTFPGNVINCPGDFKIQDPDVIEPREAAKVSKGAAQAPVSQPNADRPYMWTKEINFGGFIVGQHPSWQVVFENAGKAPALNFRAQIVVYTAPPPLPESLNFPPISYESSLFIPAGGSVNQVFIDKKFVAYEEFIQRVNREEATVYVYGRAEYDDPTGKHYTMTYCSFWNPSKKSFTACAKHNETT